jgi:hypothetical protein
VENVANDTHIELEEEGEVGLLHTGNIYSADDWKFD